MQESSRLFYVMGYGKGPHGADAFDACFDAAWLALHPIVVHITQSNCIEILLVSIEAQTETEWESWLNANETVHRLLFAQTSIMVNTDNGEACASRMIEKFMDEHNHNDNNSGVIMESHFLDAFRIASGGKMHHLDGRQWVMSASSFDDMRHARARLQAELETAWQRRFDISRQIDIARDVLSLSERLAPYQVNPMSYEAPLDEISYTILGTRDTCQMMLKLTPLFDWHDVRVLEDIETESLAHIDSVTHKLTAMDNVIERQQALASRKRLHSAI